MLEPDMSSPLCARTGHGHVRFELLAPFTTYAARGPAWCSMSRRAKRPASALSVEEREAADLLQQLKHQRIVAENVHAHTGLLLAARDAVVNLGVDNDTSDAALRVYLPAGQRKVARLRVWMRHLQSLRALQEPVAVVQKRARSAPQGPLASAPCGPCDSAGAVDSSRGLPVAPVHWKAIRAAEIGLGYTSASRALARLRELNQVLARPGIKLTLPDCTHGGGQCFSWQGFDYIRASVSGEVPRQTLLRACLGHSCISELRPIPGADSTKALAVVAADARDWPNEGSLQLWLSKETTQCTMHCDEPDSVLIVLGGQKSLALLPPSAPRELRLVTRGERKLDRHDARSAPQALLHDEPTGELGKVLRRVTLRPGEAIFIPSGWWHAVESEAGTVGLSMPVARAVL